MRKYVALVLSLMLLLTGCGKNQTGSTWQEQYDLGVRYLSEGNYEEAIIAFTAAIEIDSNRVEAYIARGDTYIADETEENLVAALADYAAALEIDEKNVQACLCLADVYIRQGLFDKAAEILNVGFEKTGDQRIRDKAAEFETMEIRDTWGRIRRKIYYDDGGTPLFYAVYQYWLIPIDVDIPLMGSTVTTYNMSGEQIAHGKELFDSRGNPIEYFSIDDRTGELGLIRAKYDEYDNQILFEDYRADGSLGHRVEMFYNEQGQRIKTYDSYPGYDAGPSYVTEYIYDGNGDVVEERVYLGKGLDHSLTDYYDVGCLKYVHLYESGNFIGTQEYDATGNIIGTTSNGT